jgi:hypothetical protein
MAMHSSKPIYAYRGEHGEDAPAVGFHTRLPSISFGTERAARVYAANPNDPADGHARNPRIRRYLLTISNPITADPQDPFLDLSAIAERLGHGFAREMALRHAGQIMHTNNWEENFADRFSSVEDLLARDPSALNKLYLYAYPLLDDPDFIAAARVAGYDGAIYGGVGDNACEPEYRIFDASQAVEVGADDEPVREPAIADNAETALSF